MKIRYLCLVLLVSVIVGCSKKENIIPVREITTTTDTIPTVFAFANVLQSNMVVQRDKPFKIWGTAPPSQNIIITVSWNSAVLNAVADAKGNWLATVPPAPPNTNAQTITAKPLGSKTFTLNNVLIGDVWLCSGQSNMVMPLDSVAPFRGVLNFRNEIATADYPQIRAFTIGQDYELKAAGKLKYPGNWQVCSLFTAAKFSAVAYYFARKLNTTLNVPIGIVISATDGSYCQDWTNTEVFQSNPSLLLYQQGTATLLYNGMINPITNLGLKGFIWYQGENNQLDSPPSNYTLLNAAMIGGWRSKFNQGELPFYLTQLAPFADDYYNTDPPGGDLAADDLAFFREAQGNVLSVPSTGMAVTMDVGEPDNHHPRNKKPVGERLALLALKNTYGQNVACNGPGYQSFTANGNLVTINYVSGTATGLTTINKQPLNQLFFVAGTDHVLRRGSAVINGSNILITAPAGTPLPVVSVRYAFTNSAVTNLQNVAGLRAEPFRAEIPTN